MVDTGGGNGILGILEKMNVDMAHIHHILSPMSTQTISLGFLDGPHDRHCHEKGKYEGEPSHLLPSGTGRYDLHLMPFNTSGNFINDRGNRSS